MGKDILLIVFSSVCLLFSVPMLVGSFCYLSRYLGFRNGKTDITYGELVETHYRKNAYVARQWHKHYTTFAYKYKIDGKEYLVSERKPLRPHNLSRIEKIVYQTKYPKRAYIPKYSDYRDDILAVTALLVISVMFLAAGLLILDLQYKCNTKE